MLLLARHKDEETRCLALGRQASRLDNLGRSTDQVEKEETRPELSLEERLAEAEKILAKWEEEEPEIYEPKQWKGSYYSYGYETLKGEPTTEQIRSGIAVPLFTASTTYVHYQE